MQPLVPGVTLLPSAGTCFRTWHPARGPLRSLLKNEQGEAYYWLIGPPAALWEAVEPGITLGKLRRRAEALQVGHRLDALVLEWYQAGWIALRGGAPGDEPARASVAPGSGPAPRAPAPLGTPSPSLIPTDLREVQHWMGKQGLAFSASWALDQATQDLRQAMERLDFLRHSGVFRIHFTVHALDPNHQHIRLAARAQGFECVGPD
jgi:hypothetical protein